MAPRPDQTAEHEMLHPSEHGQRKYEFSQQGRRADENPRRPRTWRVAASMGASIVVGLLFGLIHHFFYTYWNGKVVDSDSQQRWIIRGGTAFAFGFKTALALGTSIAYVQYLWLIVANNDMQVGKINSMFKVLGNALELFDLRLWFRMPVLAVLAIITWTLPLAAIVSPGTLIVRPSSGNRTQQVGVPQFDYRDYTKFAAALPIDNAGFAGASNDLIQLSVGSATTQSILPISPPIANSTYSINMSAPALSCEETLANNSIAIAAAYYNFTATGAGAGITYIAWTPGFSPDVPPVCYNGSMVAPREFNGSTRPSTIDLCFNGYSKKLNILIPYRYRTNDSNGDTWSDAVLLNCSLRNASYSVDFDFRNRAQLVNVQKRELLEGVVGLDTYLYLLNSKNKADVTLGNKLLSYVSVMDAFGRIMVGTIYTYHYGTVTPYYTLVLSTGLKPLLPVDSFDMYTDHPTSNATIARAVENLFENVTLSMLSSNDFTVDFSNATDAAGIPLTDVTVFYPQNIYTYEPQQLWLAYGIAIIANILCLLVGLYAIHRNGLSYNSDFITILRTTRKHNLDLLVTEAESNGAEPAPLRMKKGTLTFTRSTEDGWAGFSIKGMR